MSDWPTVTLKEAGVTLIDCDHKTPKAREEGMPYVGIPQLKEGRVILDGARLINEDDFHHWRRKAKPTPNDVILSRRCNPGETAYVPEGMEIALGQNLVLLRSGGEKLYPPFLRWAVQGSNWWNQISKFINVGAVFDSLKCVDIPKFEIKLLPMDQQVKISEILGDLDKKIELNRQTNQTLEQIAQAIFKSWFVDFEPVKAKIQAKRTLIPTLSQREKELIVERAAMCAISGKSLEELEQLSPETQQQLKTTAALFPDALVESELGEIPEGWEVKSLAEIAENHSTTFDFSKVDKVVFVNTGDVLQGRFLHRNFSSKEGLPGQAKKTIKKDDLLFSEIRPKNKRFAYVNEDCDDYVVSTKFMIIRSLGFVHPRYLYQILRQDKTIQEFNLVAESRSGTFPQITFDSIGYLPIVVPPEIIQNIFMVFFFPIIQKIEMIVREEKSLEELRDTLLPKLLSGELTLEAATTKEKAEKEAMGLSNA